MKQPDQAMRAYRTMNRIRLCLLLAVICPVPFWIAFHGMPWIKTAMWVLVPLYLTTLYVLVLWFYAKSLCPWCGEWFFAEGTNTPTGNDYCFRRHCANCGMPERKQHKKNT